MDKLQQENQPSTILTIYQNLDLLDQFILARWAYSIDEQILGNEEYTILQRAVSELYPDSEYVHRSWSSDTCPTELLKRLGLESWIHKVVLMDKTESIPSLGSMLEVKRELSTAGPGTVSMKHDGWNIQANYYNGRIVNVHTRGRASDAIDVSMLTDNLPRLIPVQGSVKIVMELTVSLRNFIEVRRYYNCASPRSAVRTVLAHSELFHLLSFNAFDVHGYTVDKQDKFNTLREWGFSTPDFIKVNNYEDILSAVEVLSDSVQSYGEPTDGAVYDGTIRRAIRILSWEEPLYMSYVIGYDEKYGPYRISPSVKIYPILRKGSVQTQINLTNWQRIMDYNLAPGAPIAFRVASQTNADFDENMTRILHKQWKGKWDEYRKEIEMMEEENRIKWEASCTLQNILQH